MLKILLSVFAVFGIATLFFLLQSVFSKEPGVCAQVITSGRNPATGEIKEFKTPCDVPKGWDTLESGGGQEITRDGITSKVYWNSDLAISFEYIVKPDGYTIFQSGRRDGDHPDLVAYLAIRNTKEYEAFLESKFAREGPPEISVRIFENKKKIDAFAWLNENAQAIHYNKEEHPIARSSIGGVEALEFLSDGLYMQKNFLMESNGKIYLVSGPEDGSFKELKRDFGTFVRTIVIF